MSDIPMWVDIDDEEVAEMAMWCEMCGDALLQARLEGADQVLVYHYHTHAWRKRL